MPRLTLPLLAGALLVLPAAAAAQDLADYDYENLSFNGLGVHVSQVFPSRIQSTPALTVRADLGLLGPNVRIAPGLTFWSSRLQRGEVRRMEERIEALCNRAGSPCPGIELGEIRVSDLALEVDAHYLLTTDFNVEPYFGVGVSLHLLNGRGDFIEDTFVEELLDAIAPGLSLIGGVELPLAPALRLIGEGRGVITGNVRYVSVGIGASWTIPAGSPSPRTAARRPR
jgi:hypothetical protein